MNRPKITETIKFSQEAEALLHSKRRASALGIKMTPDVKTPRQYTQQPEVTT